MADSEAPGSSKTREDGPDVSKPAPVPDGAPGTPQAAAKANGAAGEVVPKRRKGGRAKGSPKVPGSGRRKTLPEPTGRAGREYLAKNSGCLDLLCRILSGKPIHLSGPTGKRIWFYPTFDDVKWAAGLTFPRLVPQLTAQELTGADGAALAVTTNEPTEMREIARRLALIFQRADPLAESEAHGDAVVPATATPSAFSSAFVQNAPGYTRIPVAASGGPDTPEGASDSPVAAEADEEPKVPKVGQVAFLDYTVRIVNSGPVRDGLPDVFTIINAAGKIIKHCGGDYSAAVVWARGQYNLPDAKITIATDPKRDFLP